MRSFTRLAALTMLPLLLAVPAVAADPFYVDLARRGSEHLDAGDNEEAARLLRIAAFGLLDEPPQLAETLVRLALAQSRLRDGDAFRDTFERLLEIEERFGAYRSATLPAQLRATFEETAPQHVSEETLRSAPPFAELAERRAQLRLSTLPPKEQRRQLERRVEERPEDPGSLLAVALFEVREGRRKRAIGWLDRALVLESGSEEARCLRGRLQAEVGDCRGAAADLALCPPSSTRPELATPYLHCLVKLKQWPQARMLLDGLSEPLRATAEVARLAVRIEAAPQPEPEASTALPAAQPRPADLAPPVAAPGPVDAPPREPAPADLKPVRAALRQAADLEALATVLVAARDLADAHPADSEAQLLAAEAAYRSSDWQTAIDYFDRAGPLPADRPLPVFYRSVSLYELGRIDEAAGALRRALPHLARTPFVDAYAQRILGTQDPS